MLPGPSAPVMALALSGLPSDRFLFGGFLPPKEKARREAIAEAARAPVTLVFFETAPRLADALRDLQAVLGDRPAAVARELTKMFEEVRRDRLSALIAHYDAAGAPKGEIVIVIGPPSATLCGRPRVSRISAAGLMPSRQKIVAAKSPGVTGSDAG